MTATKYQVFFDENGNWSESILEINYDRTGRDILLIASPCGEVWFNDQETDHIHRCSSPVPHDDYHRCGHTWGDIDGIPTLCGVQW